MDHSKDKSVVSEQASDFKEDPFQNYRYEDPFLISDPFQDEEEAPAIPPPAKCKISNKNFSNKLNYFSLPKFR